MEPAARVKVFRLLPSLPRCLRESAQWWKALSATDLSVESALLLDRLFRRQGLPVLQLPRVPELQALELRHHERLYQRRPQGPVRVAHRPQAEALVRSRRRQRAV